MNSLKFNNNKTLKLNNVLMQRILFDNIEFDINVQVEQTQSFIKVKGTNQIGPLIQYTNTYLNEQGEMDIEILLMLQCNSFIHNLEKPYKMESVMRITNCMYCRFIGPEDKLKLAYDKINVMAFEENITLKGDSYTIFVDKDLDNGTITADVFMPKI